MKRKKQYRIFRKKMFKNIELAFKIKLLEME